MKTLLKTIITLFVISTTLLFAQDGPLVAGEGEKKVITSGYGKNPDEALTQALRNAVEEAVGTYMSSTTRIENDDIIEDKILSLSRGFIKDFKKLTEMRVEDEIKVTVAVIVTKTQILETLKASGVKVEIKGGLLFAQYDQEEKQIEDEFNIISEYTKNIPQEHPFDYLLEYGTPVKQSDSRFKIPLKIGVSVNQNYHNQYANLKSFLNEIAVEKSLASARYKKRITEAEVEKIEQRYGSKLTTEYSDIFKNSSFSPYAVMLEESEDVIAYRLLNERSIKSLERLIKHYFYTLRFMIVAQSTVKSKIPVFINLSHPIREINEGNSSIRLEDGIAYKYKNRLNNDSFNIIDKRRRIDGIYYKTVNLNEGHILNKEFLTLSFDLFIEEAFMQSLSSLEVSPPLPWDGGPVTDIDGNTYKTVRIGSQTWMAENLKVAHYRNGDPIPTGHSNSAWGNLSTGAYAVYDGNESNADTYGYLYNWFAVDDSRNIAPEGWHIPTDTEWTELTDYLVRDGSGKMKEAGTEHWNSPNTGATNESGFTALPGGYRSYDGGDDDSMGSYGYFWSSTEKYSDTAWGRRLHYYRSGVDPSNSYKHSGVSVRCVRD